MADRLTAPPGTKEYGLLTVICGVRYRIDPIKHISRNCCYPPPDVTSSIVKMVRDDSAVPPQNPAHLLALLKDCFAQRRKQLLGILSRREQPAHDRDSITALLAGIGIEPSARPEELPCGKWIALSDALSGGTRFRAG